MSPPCWPSVASPRQPHCVGLAPAPRRCGRAMVENHLPVAQHEAQDLRFGSLALGLGLTLVGLAACALLVIWLYPGAATDRRLPTALPDVPAPRLQANPRADLEKFRQQQMARLNGTFWADQAHGIAHIPIGDAMRRVAEHGIPDWPGAAEK